MESVKVQPACPLMCDLPSGETWLSKSMEPFPRPGCRESTFLSSACVVPMSQLGLVWRGRQDSGPTEQGAVEASISTVMGAQP